MKIHYFEGLCSFFIVGLGQIIKGEGQKGTRLLLTFYFACPAASYASLLLNNVFFLYILGAVIISAIILWLYSIGDALIK
ncbi:MAG: hypothetical protein ABIH69_01140 [bacterium]|nr:hypothetical protein [Candidatus Margulisiibacteriota bacterium]